MTGPPTNPDVVIIGAGAAGVGAGLALTRLGVPFVIIEAKDRVGGRAYSEAESVGSLWDHGCHWFHSADINPLRAIADRMGHRYRARAMQWVARYYLDGHPLDETETARVRRTIETYFEQADAAARSGSDRAAGTLIDPRSPYAGYLHDLVAAITSAPADELSLIDNGRYAGTELDYPVSGGYGALIARLAAGLPILLGTPANAITCGPKGVTVTTPAGPIIAKAAILTCSVAVLAAGRIALTPALPRSVLAALEHVRCGDVEKIAIEFSGNPFDGLTDTTIRVASGDLRFFAEVRPYDRPVIVAHVCGALARGLTGLSDRDAGAAITASLAEIFGSKLTAAAGRARATRWSRDPDIAGAYSYVRVGHADKRQVLIAADLAPLHLAGEAMTLDHYSTCHGAYLSGLTVAHRVAESIGRPALSPDPAWLPS